MNRLGVVRHMLSTKHKHMIRNWHWTRQSMLNISNRHRRKRMRWIQPRGKCTTPDSKGTSLEEDKIEEWKGSSFSKKNYMSTGDHLFSSHIHA